MKVIILCLTIILPLSAPAQERLEEIETTKGRVYKNVTIKGKGALGIKISHAGGLANVPFSDLSEALRQRFGFDPVKAKAAKIKNAIAAAAKQKQQAKDKAARAEAIAKANPPETKQQKVARLWQIKASKLNRWHFYSRKYAAETGIRTSKTIRDRNLSASEAAYRRAKEAYEAAKGG